MPPATWVVLLALCPAGLSALATSPPPLLDRLPLLDPNGSDLPDATIADASDLLDPPAGRHGFVFVGTDGHFWFEDGTRARFFGINVAKDAVFQPRAVIDAAVDAIARAGLNLVRLHHLDDESGLLPGALAGGKQRLDPARLDTLDYWIAKLKERGIYTYLDLLDFRTFRTEEGVSSGPALGRGAKPYAVFNERLIDLQRDYARQLLLEHENRFTGLPYAADPAVCLIELCDENGLFREQERLGRLIAPYRDELVRRWNFWLLSQYGSRDELARVWTDDEGRCYLGEHEDPRQNTVGLPGVTPNCDTSLPRLASRNMFFADTHCEYFRALRSFLRHQGLRCPISAVTKPELLPDLWAVAQELDFVAINYYFDHPYFRAGSEWQLPAFFTGQDPLRNQRAETLAPRLGAMRVIGKPLVVREWNVCWPNEHRAPGMLEATAYACLQDIDALILFALDTRPGSPKLDYFDLRHDPTRWGLVPLCARMFLQRQVRPAAATVAYACSPADVFYPAAGPLPTAFHELARVARVATGFCDPDCQSMADLTVVSGRTAGLRYVGKRGLISSASQATDACGKGRNTAAALAGYPTPRLSTSPVRLKFGGTLHSAGVEQEIASAWLFPLSQVTANPHLRPIGLTSDGRSCLGVRDMQRDNYVFGALDEQAKLRVALDALGHLLGPAISHAAADRRVFTAESQQLTTDQRLGLLWVNTPLCCAIAGEVGRAEAAIAGALELRPNAQLATCIWQSLDGLPAAESRRWQLKFVTVARNTGQQVRVHLQKKNELILALDGPGGSPVTTGGQPSASTTTVLLGGRPQLAIYMRDGLFELYRDGNRIYLYCDTPGAQLNLPVLGPSVTAVFIRPDGTRWARPQLVQPFEWPENVALLEIIIGNKPS